MYWLGKLVSGSYHRRERKIEKGRGEVSRRGELASGSYRGKGKRGELAGGGYRRRKKRKKQVETF